MRIVHVCAGWEENNGAARIARLLMDEQTAQGHETVARIWASPGELKHTDEVWIHCAWKPCLWWAAWWGRRVVWVPEASYDPVRLGFHGWKKRLAGPFERWALRRADRVLATCEAEKNWILRYEPRVKQVEVTDIKRFFRLDANKGLKGPKGQERRGALRALYMGRAHPLKGLEYLERAVAESGDRVELKVASRVFGEEKERIWDWCQVLVLPTLSDNFGLVVAEALERGKRVIVTDGAPAWGDGDTYGGRLKYVKGFLAASDSGRTELLREALAQENA
jgi:glycosyltransferase involved in cell wall biosynthesis